MPSHLRTIFLNGQSVSIKYVEHRRAKRLILRIETGGRHIRLTAPPGVSFERKTAFIMRHKSWLEAKMRQLHQDIFSDLQGDKTTGKFFYGTFFPFLGKNYRIFHSSEPIDGYLFREEGLFFSCSERMLGPKLQNFLEEQGKVYIRSLIEDYLRGYSFERCYKKFKLKDMKTRWGSCSLTGSLSFSWRIMMAPKEIVSYLVAHEVAHLKEMNHGKKFWQLCEILCPNAQEYRKWLRINGSKLHYYDFTEH